MQERVNVYNTDANSEVWWFPDVQLWIFCSCFSLLSNITFCIGLIITMHGSKNLFLFGNQSHPMIFNIYGSSMLYSEVMKVDEHVMLIKYLSNPQGRRTYAVWWEQEPGTIALEAGTGRVMAKALDEVIRGLLDKAVQILKKPDMYLLAFPSHTFWQLKTAFHTSYFQVVNLLQTIQLKNHDNNWLPPRQRLNQHQQNPSMFLTSTCFPPWNTGTLLLNYRLAAWAALAHLNKS